MSAEQPKVLLTGGRAPATLELARLLFRAGCEVHLAESMAASITSFSGCVKKNHRVPPPNQEPDAFVAALRGICRGEGIDLLVPTCEEVFWVARGHAHLSEVCEVFTEPLERLRPLHSKWAFTQRAFTYGLAVPETELLTSPEAVQARADEADNLVFKPVFSRFAVHVKIRPDQQTLNEIQPTPSQPWVAQKFVEGRHLCTWSVARNGVLKAHSAYAVDYRAGKGSAIAFAPLIHPEARQWVEEFVFREGYTGLIAFDFVDTADGLFALECNPRLTSGVHLFADCPEILADALLDRADRVAEPTGLVTSQLGFFMLMFGLPKSLMKGSFRPWWRTFARSRDVVNSLWDPWPMLMCLIPVAVTLGLAARHRVDPLVATTLDIEWNGQ